MLKRRFGQIAFAVVTSSLLVVGCRGLGDRNFYDDEAEAGGGDGAALDDATSAADADGSTTATGDGSTDDASLDAGSDAAADTGADAGPPRTIGGTVVGLSGTGMVLQLNGASDLPVSPTDGGEVAFTFSQALFTGSSFDVTIKTQPSSPVQTCVANGSGVVGNGNVTSVVINCLKDKYTIGGTIEGLEGSIVLKNGTEKVTLNANGSFSFLTPQDNGASYLVSIDGHSALPDQTCNLSNASGKVNGASVGDVDVSCTTKAYTIGGSVSGTGGGAIQLTNGPDTITVNGDAPFTFPTSVLSNHGYFVSLGTPPPGKTCTIKNFTGTVTTSNVGNVTVTCVPQYALVENFDGVVAPALPTGWTTTVLAKAGGNPAGFFTSNTTYSGLPAADTTPNSCLVQNESLATDEVLTSPTFNVATSTATLTFVHSYSLEASNVDTTTGYDGVVLEISIAGGAFTQLANSAFTAGGYTRTIATGFDNPLTGKPAWSGRSASGWTTTTAALPLAAGQSAKIRFRLGTDKRNVVCSPNPCAGWRLDTLFVAN